MVKDMKNFCMKELFDKTCNAEHLENVRVIEWKGKK